MQGKTKGAYDKMSAIINMSRYSRNGVNGSLLLRQLVRFYYFLTRIWLLYLSRFFMERHIQLSFCMQIYIIKPFTSALVRLNFERLIPDHS